MWNGHAESDGFNALVLGAGLTWRQVVIIRTVAKYLRQTQTTFSQDYVENALVQNLPIAANAGEPVRGAVRPQPVCRCGR